MAAVEDRIADAAAGNTVRVWDPVVRVCHWGLAASLLVSFLTHEGNAAIHIWSGYAALAFVTARIAWGFSGATTPGSGPFSAPRAIRSPTPARSPAGGRSGFSATTRSAPT